VLCGIGVTCHLHVVSVAFVRSGGVVSSLLRPE
jgi:hypothetical protein